MDIQIFLFDKNVFCEWIVTPSLNPFFSINEIILRDTIPSYLMTVIFSNLNFMIDTTSHNWDGEGMSMYTVRPQVKPTCGRPSLKALSITRDGMFVNMASFLLSLCCYCRVS